MRTNHLITRPDSNIDIDTELRPARPGALPSPTPATDPVPLPDRPAARERRLRAALDLAPTDAVVTGREAMWLNGIPIRPRGAIHLVAPSREPGRADGSVVVERTDRMPDPRWRRGFPTAPLPRATVDACRRGFTIAEVRAVAREAVERGGATIGELHAELVHSPGYGTTLLRRALAEIDRGVRSIAARRVTGVVDLAELPPPNWTARLSTPDDVHLAIVDAWWDDVGLAWDADLHRAWTPDSLPRAFARVTRLRAAGIVAVRTDAERMRVDPAGVARELRAAYGEAAGRPKPEVIMS
ncbi:hypothetical protein [Actinokineospora enzanensis]|uniref:hypothetical protein n=1 Tax=Actinokineospora enzanensis TaxID=155975 RepID=UPI00036420DD|nr:hypothetical protein [Actinokineospora enzanensis]